MRTYEKTRTIYNGISKNSIKINEDETADFLENTLKNFSSQTKYLYLSRYQEVVDALKVFKVNYKNMKILDVGCGDGYLLKQIEEKFDLKQNQLYGIDISTRRIKLARRRIKRANFFVGDAEKLPFPNEYFDVVLCIETLEHLMEPPKAANEIKRVLKPSGKIILTTPSKHAVFLSYNPLTWVEAILSLHYPGVLPSFHNLYEPCRTSTVIHRAFVVKELISFFADCADVKYKTIIFSYFTFFESTRFTTLSERLFRKIPVLNELGKTVFVKVTK